MHLLHGIRPIQWWGGIQPLAVRRLFNGLDALQFAAGWAVNCNHIFYDFSYFLLTKSINCD